MLDGPIAIKLSHHFKQTDMIHLDHFFSGNCRIALHLILFLFLYSASHNDCLAQLKSLSLPLNQNLPSPIPPGTFQNNEYPLLSELDFGKLKSDYQRLNQEFQQIEKFVTDSSSYINNKDSVAVLLKLYLESQKQILEDLSLGTEEFTDQDFLGSKRHLLNAVHEWPDSNLSIEEIPEVLNTIHLEFQTAFKEKVIKVIGRKGIKGLTGDIHKPGFALDEPFFEFMNDERDIMKSSAVELKDAPMTRINRKVGFENIEYKEVIFQAEPSIISSTGNEKLKFGLIYNLNDGISLSSMIQGNLSFRLLPVLYGLVGANFKSGDILKKNVYRTGYGGIVGVRMYVFNDWYVQGVYERNFVEYSASVALIDQKFKGFVNGANISIGKEIKILPIVYSNIQIDWNPDFDRTKSLQGSAVLLKVGFSIPIF